MAKAQIVFSAKDIQSIAKEMGYSLDRKNAQSVFLAWENQAREKLRQVYERPLQDFLPIAGRRIPTEDVREQPTPFEKYGRSGGAGHEPQRTRETEHER